MANYLNGATSVLPSFGPAISAFQAGFSCDVAMSNSPRAPRLASPRTVADLALALPRHFPAF
jgi:hypothetical protein